MLNKIIKDAMLFPIFREPFDVDAAEGTGDYAVLGKNPGLAFDFIQNDYYVYPEDKKIFSDAITHAMTSNSVMTDGYGPELITNGSFDSNIDDWSVSNGTASWVGGQLLLNETGSDGVTARAYQTITTVVGTTYWVTARVGDVSTGTGIAAASNSTSIGGKPQQNSSGNETVSFAFVAEATTTYIVLAVSGTTARTVYFNNVSVKEMPVLKWAPHNLLTYSEDLNNAAWTKSNTSITPNDAIAPDGTQTADKMQHTTSSANVSGTVTDVIATTYTVGVFVKSSDHQWFRIFADVGSAWFDLTNELVGTVDSGLSNASITDVGNGWYLCQVDTVPVAPNLSLQPLLATANGGFAESTTTSAHVWGIHVYRSDLGGMVDNPDQPLSRASYVPTTSSDVYLPRIGHHVYNGSA